ncbi:ABC transporter permease subunit [Microbacterium hominis]|uniref:ABC transporter permease n=1 Tax=Microbacterium hominis TaxID=162426 RepID=A0A7D4UFK4_9MICO|nr:ABC transporter permease subunit [Microbacterium hominis]QKJ18389.1 ABC transporter permease [Microbacterium hominis]
MRSPLAVFRRTMRESLLPLIGWIVGIVGAILIYLPIYESMAGDGQIQAMMDSLPPEMVAALGYDQIGSGAGYTQATFFGLVGFALFVIAATGWGAGAIGGAEESGRLELDLAHGVGRVGYALEQGLAIVVRVLALGVAAGLVILAINEPSRLELPAAGVVLAVLALSGLALLSGTLALLVGALTGRRIWAVGLGAGVAVAGYALNAVGRQSDDAAWMRTLSPYAWAYRDPPLEGEASAGILLVWAVALGLAAAAAWALHRRDVTG